MCHSQCGEREWEFLEMAQPVQRHEVGSEGGGVALQRWIGGAAERKCGNEGEEEEDATRGETSLQCRNRVQMA